MPEFSKTVPVPGATPEETFKKLDSQLDRFLEKSQIGSFSVQRDPQKREFTLKHSMATASLRCLEGSVQVSAKLSLLAAPFRSKLEQNLDSWLKKILIDQA